MGQIEQNQYVEGLLNWSRELKKAIETDIKKSYLAEKVTFFETDLSMLQGNNTILTNEELINLTKKATELYRDFNYDEPYEMDHYNAIGKRKETALKRVPIGEHRLPALPYAYDALQPYIDEEIMRLHHSEHHKGYVDGLNKAEKEMEKARKKGDFDLIKHWEREAAFNGAGHYLHTIFWNVMSPKGGGKPKGALSEQIELDFGSFAKFKEHFSEAAKKVEAVGWAILVWAPRAGRLEILQAEKHQNVSQWDNVPILALDVWEHAYYLQYKNKRNLYVDNWWNVIDWDYVNERFMSAKQLHWQPF